MNNSLKIGIVAGLVAGFIAGIVASISNTVANLIDLPNPLVTVPTTNIPEIYIFVNIIWGIIFGIIFSIAHDLIPGKYISKGLFYGLVIFLITNIRDYSYLIIIGVYTPFALCWYFIGFFQSITYGIILGLLYRLLSVKYGISITRPEIKTYSVMSGIQVGAIAGLLGGAFALLSRVLGGLVGLFPFMYVIIEGEKIVIEDFTIQIISGIASQLFINMVWGIIFGIIFVKAYNVIPGKGVKKGLIFGMLFFLVASCRLSVYFILWGDLDAFWTYFFIGFFNALFYGLFLGLLYRKPTEATSEKEEEIQVVKIVKCIHCNASITKGSEYCNKCGKKQ
jgi:hypothetical protein